MQRLRTCALVGVLLTLAVLLFASYATAGTALAGKSIGISPDMVGSGAEAAGFGNVAAAPARHFLMRIFTTSTMRSISTHISHRMAL